VTQPRPTQRTFVALAVLTAVLVVAATAVLLWPDDIAEPAIPEMADSAEATIAAPPNDSEPVASPTAPESASPDAGTASVENDPLTPSERLPAIIVSARTEDGTPILTVDYIQFLTGDEAATAAAERGDESPPPNDYYIVNDNTRLREFLVQEGVSVVTVVQDDGTSDPSGHALPLTDWIERLSGPAGSAFTSSFYWLTVSSDTITTIEQQYLP